MKRIKYIILIILINIGQAYADGDALVPKGKIKGVVADAKTKEPLEYATIALYRASDKLLITGSITDYLGHFKFEQPDVGEYYLIITFIGLEEVKSDVFNVEDEHNNINLGNFMLKSASKELGEVEVVGKRAAIEYKIDKKIINVDKQITSAAGSAVDVLESVPSVQVDVEGNVSLRGSTGFTVLIDGKPTILDPSDALRQIPSSSIENIEIITNPSVKYEPDGSTGIINIITKKNRLEGFSGIVNANVGMYDQYGGDFQLSYRANKFNFILGGNYNKRSRPGEVTNERETFSKDTLFFVNSFGDTKRQHTSTSIRAGIEYNPTSKDFISLSGRFGNWDMSSNSTLRYDDWTEPGDETISYNSLDETTRGGNYYSIDGLYQHDFSKTKKSPGVKGKGPQARGEMKGFKKPSVQHLLKFKVNYRNRYNDEFTTNELRTLTDTLLGGKKNVEKGPSESLRVNIDYTLPIGKEDKFEGGLQFRGGKSNDITELWLYDTDNDSLIFVPEFSNTTDYNRNIYAAYALYAGTAGSFGYQAGLRAEYTDRKIKMTGEDDFLLNRWDFFPTIHLSYSLPKEQQLMASYSRRIHRPRGWYLEPFITWQDAYNVRKGNPDLKPEYIDSYEAGYLITFNDNFYSLEGYYRVTHNKIERVSSVYEENVMLHTFENVGEDYSLGLEAMFNFNLFKWWEMQISGNFFNYKVEGELTLTSGDETVKDPFKRTSTNWNSRFNNTFTLWKNGVLQINSRYNSKSVTAQGTSSDYYSVDAAFKVNFLNRQLSANLQARDIFGTSKRERISEGPNFYTYYNYNPKSPVLILSLSYRFNNFRASKRSGSNGGDGDEDF